MAPDNQIEAAGITSVVLARVVSPALHLCRCMLNEIETFASDLYDQISEVIVNPPADNIIKFTLTFSARYV